jgi:autotransporter family porin
MKSLRQQAWLAAVVVLITVAAVIAIVHYSVSSKKPPPAPSSSSTLFGTLPPGAALPSGAECAREVLASADPEVRPGNSTFNDTTGQAVGPGFLPSGDSARAQKLVSRINGDFTGTTEEILRWAACKWGIDQNVVFAQAAVQSWWEQDALGGWVTQAKFCPPGHGLGVDGRPGYCPKDYGIMQFTYIFYKSGWPGIATSTAMSVDAAYAILRSCYDGYEIWLNDEPRGQQYKAGDLWGCIGRWSAGAWYTPAADAYIALVKKYLNERIWETPKFKEDNLSAVPRHRPGNGLLRAR